MQYKRIRNHHKSRYTCQYEYMYINKYYTLHKMKIIKLQHVLKFQRMHALPFQCSTECTFIGLQVASPCIDLPAPHHNFCNCLSTKDTLWIFYSHI